MAHLLDFTTGNAAIAYRGDVPWHGYGEVITDADSLDDMRRKAQLDWEVLPSRVSYEYVNPQSEEPETRYFDNRVVLHRSDSGDALSVMSENKYEIRQPREIVEFFRDLCHAGGMQIEVLGALREGRNVWAMASKRDNEAALGKDIIKPYLALIESYDGTIATTARFTTVRIVCANTLAMSNQDKATQVKVNHNKKFDADAVKAELGKMDSAFDHYMKQVKALSQVKFTDDTMLRFFSAIAAPEAFADEMALASWHNSKGFNIEREIEKDGKKKAAVTSNAKNVVAALLNAANNGPGADLKSAKGTAFGALNAVTYYTDHIARSKNGKRWESALIGNGAGTKDAAFDLLLNTFAKELIAA